MGNDPSRQSQARTQEAERAMDEHSTRQVCTSEVGKELGARSGEQEGIRCV